MWGGGAVLHKVKTLRQRARCGMRRLGERVYAEMNNDGENWKKGDEGKQKSRRAVGLAGRELYFAK